MTGEPDADGWRNAIDRALFVLGHVPGSGKRGDPQNQWGHQGTFGCPACKTGTVRWSRAPNNGHVHFRCSTPDCCLLLQ